MNLQLLHRGGLCPACGRKLRPLPTVAQLLSALLSTSMAQTAARAQREQWSSETLAEHILTELRPHYSDATRELRCLAGICQSGSDTWG
jgi:DNA repair exonuclease SbcCD ATPase subunit